MFAAIASGFSTAAIIACSIGFLIFIHEFGHFLVAKWHGVCVLRFSLGFGPKIFGWKRGETEYWISWIPLGGYVKMSGEQQDTHPPQPGDYRGKPVGVRAAIVFAGPIMNFIVATILVWLMFVTGYPELLPVVGQVLEKTPAETVGLHKGDRIIAIGSEKIQSWDDLTKRISKTANRTVRLQVKRDDRVLLMSVMPERKSVLDPFGRKHTVGRIGIAPSGEFITRHVGPLSAIARTIKTENEWFLQTFMTFWSLFRGRISMRDSLGGPIAITYWMSEVVRLGLAPTLHFLAFISWSLAFFNFLPIPVLDGGHLLFLSMEKLRGSPVSISVQERAAQVSLVLIVMLAVVVCINDISRFGWLDKVMEWVRR